MSVTAFISILLLVAVALAYELTFTRATLEFGRFLAGEDSGTGYQDAITPPASSTVGLFTYASTLVVLALAFVFFGMGKGAVFVALFVVFVIIAGAVLPPPGSSHFRRMITGSMIRRYANYRRDGDYLRASAMSELLRRAGLVVPPGL